MFAWAVLLLGTRMYGFVCADTAADIDAIIKKGERDTADLNQKMQTFTENAMKFTMDGGINAYDFKVRATRMRPGWQRRWAHRRAGMQEDVITH